MDIPWMHALAATSIMGVGALVQSGVGFGSALIAAPLLALLDPGFVPAPVILAACTLTLLITYRERADVNMRAVSWAVAGRLPGTALGIWALAALSRSHLAILFATLVLAAVAMLALGRAPRRTRATLFAAGLTAGVMGTVTSIGGPPVALMFHDARGPELRGTLGGYFLLSTVMSLTGLSLAGLLGTRELAAFLVLLPGTVLGFLLSARLRAYLDTGYTRPAVLTLATLAALGVLLRHGSS